MNSTTTDTTWPEELDVLLEQLCEQQLAEHQRVRLNEILRLEPDARWRYLTYLDLHSALGWDGSGTNSAAATMTSMTSSVPSDDPRPTDVGLVERAFTNDINPAEQAVEPAGRTYLAGRRKRRRDFAPSTGIAITVASAAVLLLLAVLAFWSRPEQQLATAQNSVTPRVNVARLTDVIDANWETDGQRTVGSELTVDDQLQLVSGQAEITFNSGARVRLMGPARFDVQSESNGFLHLGKLTADVPAQARGFTVHTRTARVVDLGTRFAMSGGPDQKMEVHVFQGHVEVALLDVEGEVREKFALASHDAVRIANQQAEHFAAKPEQFGLPAEPSDDPVELLAEDFDYPHGPLVGNGEDQGWAGPWRNVYGGDENLIAEASLDHQALEEVGNRALIPGKYHRAQRIVDTRAGGPFERADVVEMRDGSRLIGRNGSTIEFSFLQRVGELGGGFYGVELHRSGDDDRTRVLSIGRGAVEPAYGVVSDLNGGARETHQSLGAENTNVNFIVVRIRFGPSNHDVVEVFRNPASEDQKPDARLTGDFAFDRISLSGFDGTHVHEVDELRITVTD